MPHYSQVTFMLKNFVRLSSLGLILFTGSAQAIPFQITSQLTGDPRAANPDHLFINVTINGDTSSNLASWYIDLDSPFHPMMKLHEFYFSVNGSATDYSFGNFSPVSWSSQHNDVVKGAGAGGATYTFETVNSTGAGKINVTNSTLLSFDMTKLIGNFAVSDFTSAPYINTSTEFTSQLGAHLQSLALIGAPTPTSNSGFALGNYTTGIVTTSVPEPGVLLLLGSGVVGIALSRRRRNK